MEISDIRRSNLVALIKRYPSQKEFAKAVDANASYISQIVAQIAQTRTGKPAQVGSAMARKIEEALGLSKGWMDSLQNVDSVDLYPQQDRVLQRMTINPIREVPERNRGLNSSFARVIEINGVQYVPIVGRASMGAQSFYYPHSDDNQTGDGYVAMLFGRCSQFSYALRGDGNCLEPIVRHRWIIAFDPEEALVPTEFVHVNFKDGRETIKELVAIQDNTLHLLALNGSTRIVVPMDEINGIAKFIGIFPPSSCIHELPQPEYQ